jgi:hypothetical protein
MLTASFKALHTNAKVKSTVRVHTNHQLKNTVMRPFLPKERGTPLVTSFPVTLRRPKGNFLPSNLPSNARQAARWLRCALRVCSSVAFRSLRRTSEARSITLRPSSPERSKARHLPVQLGGLLCEALAELRGVSRRRSQLLQKHAQLNSSSQPPASLRPCPSIFTWPFCRAGTSPHAAMALRTTRFWETPRTRAGTPTSCPRLGVAPT